MEKLWCALVETCGFKGNFGSWPQCRFEVHELSGMWHTARWRWMATHRCCWQCQSWMVCLWTNGYLAVIKTKGSVDSLVGRCQESAEFFFERITDGQCSIPRMLLRDCKELFLTLKDLTDRKDMRCKHGKASRRATVGMASWAWEFEKSLRFSRFGRLHFSPTSSLNDMPWPIRYCTCSLRFLPAVEGDTSSATPLVRLYGINEHELKVISRWPQVSPCCAPGRLQEHPSLPTWSADVSMFIHLYILTKLEGPFFFKSVYILHTVYGIRVLMSMNPWIHLCMSHLLHRNAVVEACPISSMGPCRRASDPPGFGNGVPPRKGRI